MAEGKRQYVCRESLPRPFCAPGSGIYAIVNRSNSKLYIGSAVGMNRRWCIHRLDLAENRHHSQHLQRAFNKSPDDFYIEVIEELPNATRETLVAREQFWMDFYQSYDRNLGYNISPTASSCKGIRHLPEYGRRISEAMKGKPPSPLQIAAAIRRRGVPRPGMGRKFTQEQREEQSRRFLGRKHPKWVREKISAALKANPSKQRPVNQYGLDGSFIARHRTILEAEMSVSGKRIGIAEACSGKCTHAAGFQWRYDDGVFRKNIGPKPARKYKAQPVKQLDLSGNIIAVHKTVCDAAKSLGMDNTSIHQAIRKNGPSAGFMWERITNA